MGIIEEAVHAPGVSRRVMGFAGSSDERQEGRTWWRGDSRIGTARGPAMVPGDKPNAGLRDIAVSLSCRAAGAIVERKTALPLFFDWAFEDGNVIGFAKVGREQSVLIASTRETVGNLCGIVRRPPDLVRTGWRRAVWSGTAGDWRGKSVRIIRGVRTHALGTIHVVVFHAIHRVSDPGLLEVVDASGLLGFRFGPGQSRKEHGREDCDNRDDDKQFDERKCIDREPVAGGRRWKEERQAVLFHQR